MARRILKYMGQNKGIKKFQSGGAVIAISGPVQYDKSKDPDYIAGRKNKLAAAKAEAEAAKLAAKKKAAEDKAKAAEDKELLKHLDEGELLTGGAPRVTRAMNSVLSSTTEGYINRVIANGYKWLATSSHNHVQQQKNKVIADGTTTYEEHKNAYEAALSSLDDDNKNLLAMDNGRVRVQTVERNSDGDVVAYGKSEWVPLFDYLDEMEKGDKAKYFGLNAKDAVINYATNDNETSLDTSVYLDITKGLTAKKFIQENIDPLVSQVNADVSEMMFSSDGNISNNWTKILAALEDPKQNVLKLLSKSNANNLRRTFNNVKAIVQSNASARDYLNRIAIADPTTRLAIQNADSRAQKDNILNAKVDKLVESYILTGKFVSNSGAGFAAGVNKANGGGEPTPADKLADKKIRSVGGVGQNVVSHEPFTTNVSGVGKSTMHREFTPSYPVFSVPEQRKQLRADKEAVRSKFKAGQVSGAASVLSSTTLTEDYQLDKIVLSNGAKLADVVKKVYGDTATLSTILGRSTVSEPENTKGTYIPVWPGTSDIVTDDVRFLKEYENLFKIKYNKIKELNSGNKDMTDKRLSDLAREATLLDLYKNNKLKRIINYMVTGNDKIPAVVDGKLENAGNQSLMTMQMRPFLKTKITTEFPNDNKEGLRFFTTASSPVYKGAYYPDIHRTLLSDIDIIGNNDKSVRLKDYYETMGESVPTDFTALNSDRRDHYVAEYDVLIPAQDIKVLTRDAGPTIDENLAKLQAKTKLNVVDWLSKVEAAAKLNK